MGTSINVAAPRLQHFIKATPVPSGIKLIRRLG